MSNLAKLAKKADESRAALREAIVADRAKGRTLEAIAQEAGMTRAGVAYIVSRAQGEARAL